MSDSPYLIALDQGTTSSRTIVFNKSGQKIVAIQREFTQHYPQSGWVEHDATEIWESQLWTLQQAIEKLGDRAEFIAAIGITNQRETLVVWDRTTGEPVAPAIVWQDRRTADDCAAWENDGWGSEVSRRTGLRLDPYFTGTKLAWLLRNTEGLKQRARQGEIIAGTVDSWLIWKLTGGKVHATDCSNASRTLLFNLESGSWDPDLLNLFEVPVDMLPEIRDSAGNFGTVAATFPGRGIPIRGVAGDQQAALFGQGCTESGMVKNTYGTGCFLLMQTGEKPVRSSHDLLTTVAWRIRGQTSFALEGAVFVAGAAVQWARDELQLVKSAEELSSLAASVPDANGVICVPAFTGLGAPHWDPYARGTLMGLTRGAGRAHICRAILESIALQSCDLIDAMEKDSGLTLSEIRVDGGATASEPLMQIQANLAGKAVIRPAELETTAWGAAKLAGLGAGVWKNLAEMQQTQEADQRFSPQSGFDPGPIKKRWGRAVALSKGWIESA
ncbi:MAG: glycerol kinase GlpK [Synoicihabitans sp.]